MGTDTLPICWYLTHKGTNIVLVVPLLPDLTIPLFNVASTAKVLKRIKAIP